MNLIIILSVIYLITGAVPGIFISKASPAPHGISYRKYRTILFILITLFWPVIIAGMIIGNR